MKTKCFNCGKEFDWEEEEEDYQPCIECDGTGTNGIGIECRACNGTGVTNLNENKVPICEDCMLIEKEKINAHKPIKNTKVTFLRLDKGE